MLDSKAGGPVETPFLQPLLKSSSLLLSVNCLVSTSSPGQLVALPLLTLRATCGPILEAGQLSAIYLSFPEVPVAPVESRVAAPAPP